MPRAGPSRSQRQPSQTQSQRYGRTQRHVEDGEDGEEVVAQYYDDDEDGVDDTGGGTVRAVTIMTLVLYLWSSYRRMSRT
jgi:hypothetical protein